MIAWTDIFGQESAIVRLHASIKCKHLPHALVFAGLAGVGKATTARMLAAGLLCERRDVCDVDPCGECESCRAVAEERHPDYHVVQRKLIRFIEGKENNMGRDLSVHVVRRFIVEPAGRSAVLGRGKVFVIEEAELMNPQAQNALLKTLEEPYPETCIILLTDEPARLLPTVLSRSQVVQFAALPIERVAKELVDRGVASKSDALEAARLSEGSLGVAIEWLKIGVIDAAKNILSLVDRLPDSSRELSDALRLWGEGYVKRAEALEEKPSKDIATRQGLTTMLRLISNHLREQLRSADAIERACDQIDAAAEADRNLEANANIQLALEYLVASMSAAAAA